ncbi:MAG TPA: hypothetical protein VF802_10125 [Candidatus Limnocylindrales bacterium]
MAICGRFWFQWIQRSECAHWAPKMRHLDLAIDRDDFPVLRTQFHPPGRRRFCYIGSTASFKNTEYLTALAARLPDTEIAWIGRGQPIRGLKPLGWADFSSDTGRALVSGFDFLVTVGRADANPTTILEAMAWGLIPVCTPQSGYAGVEGIVNVPLDDPAAAAAILARLNEAPEEELLALQAINWAALDQHYTWDRFAAQVVDAIESTESPALGPEPLSRRLRFAFYGQLSPFGLPVSTWRRAQRRGRRLLARG